jgi:hypothetical protein
MVRFDPVRNRYWHLIVALRMAGIEIVGIYVGGDAGGRIWGIWVILVDIWCLRVLEVDEFELVRGEFGCMPFCPEVGPAQGLL